MDRLNYRLYSTTTEGLAALAADQIDAMVCDAPLLRYHIKERYPGVLQVLPTTFGRQDYAIALPVGSRLREAINRILEEKIHQPAWYDRLYLYLGKH